jgi:tripartite-type tricarboxylate transporter receptor subunit TctC
MTPHQFLAALAGAFLLAAGGNAAGQAYPARPITIVVPFPAGGPTDVIARIVAEGMRRPLGQPVVIENVTGAAGSIAVGRVARAAADGYTLSFGTWSTHVVNGATLSLHYNVLNDFAPIALVSDSPMLLVGRKTLPANTLQELVAWLKDHADASLGAPGVGSAGHLAGVIFQNRTGVSLRVIPYRGVGPAMQDLISGRIDLMFDLVANSLPQVRAGSVKPYMVLAHKRLDIVPEIPTADESGLPGLYMSSWQAVWAPKGTPESSIQKLNAAVVEAVSEPTARQRLTELAQGIPAREQQTPEALASLHNAEIERWWPIIKAAGIRME